MLFCMEESEVGRLPTDTFLYHVWLFMNVFIEKIKINIIYIIVLTYTNT